MDVIFSNHGMYKLWNSTAELMSSDMRRIVVFNRQLASSSFDGMHEWYVWSIPHSLLELSHIDAKTVMCSAFSTMIICSLLKPPQHSWTRFFIHNLVVVMWKVSILFNGIVEKLELSSCDMFTELADGGCWTWSGQRGVLLRDLVPEVAVIGK